MAVKKPRPPLGDVYPIFVNEINVSNEVHVKLAVIYEIPAKVYCGTCIIKHRQWNIRNIMKD